VKAPGEPQDGLFAGKYAGFVVIKLTGLMKRILSGLNGLSPNGGRLFHDGFPEPALGISGNCKLRLNAVEILD